MPRDAFQDRLDELRAEVMEMADLVLERFDDALTSYETGDPELADEIIEGDHVINEWYLDLEKTCTDLLALQQPVAGDLRFIAASFKIVTDLERIADLATNIARYGRDLGDDRDLDIELRELGNQAAEMVEDAMDAYATDDSSACHVVADRDDDLDAACEAAGQEIVRSLIEREDLGQDEDELQALIDDASVAFLTIRDLERVGDHAVNISARTLYMVENDDSLIY